MEDPATHDAGEIEPNTHVFIVKVWREDGDHSARGAAWRGHITHVASGQRRYVTRLSQIDQCIELYLRQLDVRLPLLWRLCQWLSRTRTG